MKTEKELKNKIAELERQIKIKDKWCQLIHDIGFDYDGYRDAENLMKIIDELVAYAVRAIENDDKVVASVSLDNNKIHTAYNILGEKIGVADDNWDVTLDKDKDKETK